jgi:hypothetical protein
MSGYKKVLAQVGSEVVDQCDERTGLAPSQAIADAATLDTGISDFTGHISVDAGADSAIVECYVTAGVQIIGAVTGGAEFSATKDNVSTLNIYVEGGSIIIQNSTGGDLEVSARLF